MAIDYQVFMKEGARDLREYDIGQPPDGFESAGCFIGAILSSEDGKRYQGCRGFNDIEADRSKVYLFNRLDLGSLSAHAPKYGVDVLPSGTSEAYQKVVDDGSVTYRTDTSVLTINGSGWHWSDFCGRWQLEVRTLGRPYDISVPAQEGLSGPQLHYGELGYATGTVDGEAVAGMTFFMNTFGARGSGSRFKDLPLINVMNNGWFLWMVEFEDGDILAGESRLGKPGTNWQMAYVYRGAQSYLVSNPRISKQHSEAGPVESAVLEHEDLTVTLGFDACSVWPHVTFGTVTNTSETRKIKRSWSNMEWMPDNYDALLRGLVDGTFNMDVLRSAYVEGERVIIPGHLS